MFGIDKAKKTGGLMSDIFHQMRELRDKGIINKKQDELYRHSIKSFIENVGDLEPGAIGPEIFSDWMQALVSRGFAASSINTMAYGLRNAIGVMGYEKIKFTRVPEPKIERPKRVSSDLTGLEYESVPVDNIKDFIRDRSRMNSPVGDLYYKIDALLENTPPGEFVVISAPEDKKEGQNLFRKLKYWISNKRGNMKLFYSEIRNQFAAIRKDEYKKSMQGRYKNDGE